ncbi:MAG: GAF domain-containing protein [Verrucomicrobia bacterium]|nr:GAF domain-containing protein [Verrucomicrobiota bacterium]
MAESDKNPTELVGAESGSRSSLDILDSETAHAATSSNLVSQIFSHRLRQADVEKILAALSEADRNEFIGKLGNLLSRVSALADVHNRIADILSLDLLLKKLIEIITETLNADRSTLYLHDTETHELFSRIAQGDLTQEIRFPSTAGIAGSVFTSGESVIIDDAYRDPRFNQAIDKATGYRTRSILCMPVVNKSGIPIGVTQVLNKKGGPFTPEDERRLRAFSAQAAIALENAQLFEDVMNARNYNESILKSLSNGVITLDSEEKIIKVNEAVLKILRLKEWDIIDRPASDLFSGNNAWILDSVKAVRRSGKTDLSMDTDVVLQDGNIVSVNLAVVPLIDIKNESIGFMFVFEDISSEKRVKGTMARYMSRDLVEQLLKEGSDVLVGSLRKSRFYSPTFASSLQSPSRSAHERRWRC